jgi:MFS family permease
VKVFGEPAHTIAKLWIVASVIGIFFQPQLGRLIDRFGERAILTADAVLLMGVCLGYGSAQHLPLGAYGIYVVYGCFVLDHLLFAVGMARSTYLSKIVEDKADLMPSLSMGVSIDHFVSMSIPTLGGLLWMRAGYEYVFLAAAGIAALMLIAVRFVRVPG